MNTLIQERPVLEQLAEAVKWWNADEAEEPDVRRLFAACKAEIERLAPALEHLKSAVEDLSNANPRCPRLDLYRAAIARAERCAEGGQRRGYGKPDCPRNRAASCLCTGDYCADEHSQYSSQEKP